MEYPVVEEHPQKVRVSEIEPDPNLKASEGWVNMAVQWVVTRQTVGAENVVFGVTTLPPGARHDIHRHPHAEEVEYIIAGEGLARVGDVDVRVRTGDVVFVGSDERHGLWNTSDNEPIVVVWCYGGAASLDEAGYTHEPEAAWENEPSTSTTMGENS